MILSMVSPKGGCGKSTTALVLASVFAENPDVKVAIIDADPRQSIHRIWRGKRMENKVLEASFKVYSETKESKLLDLVEQLESEYDLIIIDLEGVAGLMATYASAASDLCIVPMRPSALDGDAAGTALQMIKDAGRTSRRKIPAYIIITQTDAAITTISHRELIKELNDNSVPRIKTELMRRAGYERMIAEGKTLYELTGTASIIKAISNAECVAKDINNIVENLA